MINNDSDDDVPQLSAETFLALQEFYNEEEQRSAIQLEVSQIAQSDADIDMSEDWVCIFSTHAVLKIKINMIVYLCLAIKSILV